MREAIASSIGFGAAAAVAAFLLSGLVFSLAFLGFKRRANVSGLKIRLTYLLLTCSVIALGVGIVTSWSYFNFVPLNGRAATPGLDLYVKGAVPVFALMFFAYRALAGAFFATTSVLLEVKAEDKGCVEDALVTMTLERGDNWLVEIAAIDTSMVKDGEKECWSLCPFPRRDDGILRLGPKESTSTQLYVRLKETHQWFTVRVVSFAVLWPVPSESYARIRLPKRAIDPPADKVQGAA